ERPENSMSSRVYSGGMTSGGQIIDAPTISWRPAGVTPIPHLAAAVSTQDTDTAAAVQQGVAAGRAEAETAANDRASANLAPILASLASVLKELADARHRYRIEAEEGTVRLALAIAQRVLHREIAIDPEAISGLVRSSFDRLNAREIHR